MRWLAIPILAGVEHLSRDQRAVTDESNGLAVGAIAIGVGSPLVADAAPGGSLDELRVRARTFRRVVQTPGPS
jgi:hypothetical protein